MKRRLNDCSDWGLSIVLASLFTMNGCGVRSTGTPGQEVSGFSRTIGQGTVIRIQRHDGLTILICSDVAGGSFGGSSKMATNPPLQRAEGTSVSQVGRRFDWLIEKPNGQKTTCRLNNKDFDLQNGTLFLVKTKEGETKIKQLTEDLSDVAANTESLTTFATKNSAVRSLLEIVDEVKGE